MEHETTLEKLQERIVEALATTLSILASGVIESDDDYEPKNVIYEDIEDEDEYEDEDLDLSEFHANDNQKRPMLVK